MGVVDREKIFLEGRFRTQENYYSKKSAENKRWYQLIQLYIVIGSVAVPVSWASRGFPRYFPPFLALV